MQKYPKKDRSLLPLSKINRKTPTDAEQKIWQFIRNRQIKYKFRRQQQTGRYIADFVCYEKALIIECDGSQHALENADKERTEFLLSKGCKILRFWNNDILNNIQGVWSVIEEALNSPSPRPSPLVEGEGKK
ncbi:MAG: endonuclease domain-containing protein [Elusimicrobiota bacterium]|jgi:very-short-patch-repair endonuclease|nr:endonuclease domain-containing protein [Elusimicrobiota bacterium]